MSEDDLKGRLDGLRSADWWSRRRLIEDLAALPSEDYLATMESWLRSGGDDLSRNIAMEVFRVLGARATPLLTVLLRDGDSDVRILAANVLGDVGDPAALAALLDAAADRIENVRIAAIEAIGKTRDPAGVAPLAVMLEDAPWAIMAAVDALGRIGGREAREVLHRFLPRGEYRGMTCAALERAGDMTTIEHLRNYIGKGEIGGLALKAMVAIVEREGSAGTNMLPAGLLAALLTHAGSPDAGLRRAAIVALGWTGDAAAVPCLIGAIDEDALQEDAIAALASLGRMAVPAILNALQAPGGQRGILAKLLAMSGAEEAFLGLVDDQDPEVRTEAALALGKVPASSAGEALRRLAADPVEEVRAAAFLALRREDPLRS